MQICEGHSSSMGASRSDSPEIVGSPRSVTDFPSSSPIQRTLELLLSGDPISQIVAAKEIRRLTKTSLRCRRQLSAGIPPLVSILRAPDIGNSHEVALLALVNLAVKDDSNKLSIVEHGALEPITAFLASKVSIVQEHATALLITLSAADANKSVICSSGAVPILADIIRSGSYQAKCDAVMALSNLITTRNSSDLSMTTSPVPSIARLLKMCKKSSKTAEKCCYLLDALVGIEECRSAIISVEGGVLAVIEVVESGTLHGREYAVSTLLRMCESDRCKYREPILREGAIPGLLELTVRGTSQSRQKAQKLLWLLREKTHSRGEIRPETLKNIVDTIISRMEGDEQCYKAKKMLAEMVQISMEESLRHLERRALQPN